MHCRVFRALSLCTIHQMHILQCSEYVQYNFWDSEGPAVFQCYEIFDTFLSLTTRTRDFRTSQSNIFAKTTKVVKLSLPVLMEPRLNLSIKKIMVENLVTLFSCWQKKDRIKSKGLEKLDCFGLQKITKGCISCLFNFVVNFFC